jgi:hypothetical protein
MSFELLDFQELAVAGIDGHATLSPDTPVSGVSMRDGIEAYKGKRHYNLWPRYCDRKIS